MIDASARPITPGGMARKLRLEFPGACYHVINRGNYRTPIFRTEGAKAAFESCLFEACARSGWVLHAFVLMSNHYHLETSPKTDPKGSGLNICGCRARGSRAR